MKPSPLAAAALLALAVPRVALAQETYPDSRNPNVVIPSVVEKCLNAAGLAVPVSSGQCANPAQVVLQDANTNQNMAIKPASTSPAATDPAAVVTLSPNTAEVGSPGTGYTQPSGGAGLSGWLSGIYHAVTGTLAVNVGQAATAGDATVAAGGTAQNLFGGATPANGFSVANPNLADDCWISDSVTAAVNGRGSYRLAANGGEYDTPPAYKPVGAVSAICPTTGDVLTARRW